MLADDLSRWPRERLARLLVLRPDLRAAADLPDLARQATSPESTRLAVDDLPAAQRTVLEAASLLPGSTPDEDLLALDPSAGASAVHAVLADLRDRLLVAEASLRTIGPVERYLPTPLGLGRPVREVHYQTPLHELQRILSYYGSTSARTKAAARDLLAELFSPPALLELVATAPSEITAVLRRYDAEGPVLREPGLNVWDGRPPTDPAARELLLAGLLVPTPAGTLELPQEVGLALRYPAVARFPLDAPPAGRPVEAAALTAPAAAAVAELVGWCDAVLDRLAAAPVALLASGAVGVRELRLIAKQLSAPPEAVSTVVSLLLGVGVLAPTSKDLRVTGGQRAWSALSEGQRWTELVQAWLSFIHAPPSARKLVAVSAYLAYDFQAVGLRERLLRLLDAAGGRSMPDEQWLARWQARWPEQRRTEHDRGSLSPESELRADLLGEAARLGLLVDSAPSPLLGVLLGGGDVDAALAEAATVGETSVHAQADGTLVCTSRPARAMKAALDRIATVESSAQATVWRLSEASLAQAYEHGDTPEQVLEVLGRYASPVPQAMGYLVRDAYRRLGRARVFAGAAVVVVDDDAVLVSALTRKGPVGKALAQLGVRRVAAGVAVSHGSVEATVAALRRGGVPAVASASGGTRPPSTSAARRAPTPAPRLAPLPVHHSARDLEDALDRLVGG